MGKRKSRKQNILSIILIICIIFFGYVTKNYENLNNVENIIPKTNISFELSTIPEYSSSPYVEINNNIPDFKEEDYILEPFEKYSQLDILGRSGIAYANICKEVMPKNRRRKRRNWKY